MSALVRKARERLMATIAQSERDAFYGGIRQERLRGLPGFEFGRLNTRITRALTAYTRAIRQEKGPKR